MGVVAIALILLFGAGHVLAQDIDGVSEHPMIERYPGQVIAWQHIENYQPYKVPIGPVSGYRSISHWIETEGRVTRTLSSGGAGAIVARKERAAGTAYVVVYVEQHSRNYVGTLVDIVEVEAAETGLVVVDAEAMGSDIDEYGRVVLDGIVFDFDKATLKPESKAALDAIAEYLNANPDKRFYVVGHTDSTGTFAYISKLSTDRARTVADALKKDYGIAPDILDPYGVGPLAPVFSNSSDAGREQN